MKLTVIYLTKKKLIGMRTILVFIMFIVSYMLYKLIITGETLGRYKYKAWEMSYTASFIQYITYIVVIFYFLFFGFKRK
ncbi:hypothetical protein VHA01S_038_00330 [Vibrio halioticoli NBRC 102217]|uniref:Uncharacterized protein n=1 Tax=Vibrio halioticoli NBRC 102217 TaxID=1219072 RepID=V5FKK6_9VIBR|nr:hypothetical protein VHA01S_038_00330 [Vibrio halioticoli NBRC 102217]